MQTNQLTGEQGRPGRIVLAVFGVALLGLFLAGFIVNVKDGNRVTMKTPLTRTETIVTKTESAKGGVEAGAASGKTLTTTETTIARPLSRINGARPRRSTTTTDTINAPSEGVLLALLGLGTALLLMSAFYARLTTIKLPGGVELDLTPEEKKTVAKAVKQSAASDLDPQMRTLATLLALDEARDTKAESGGSFGSADVAQVVSSALEIAQSAAAP